MMKFIIFIYIIVANLSFAEESPNPAPSPTVPGQTEEQHKSGTNQEKSGDCPPSNQPVPTVDEIKPKSGERISKNKDNNATQPTTNGDPSQSPATPNWLVVIFTGVLAAAAVVQLFIYARQARYMREGLEITRQSVKAAQDSAGAATKSAEVAEAALKLTERAYVVIGRWQWSSPEAAHPGTISCFLTNTGRTEAHLFGYFIDRLVDKKPSSITVDYRQHLMGRQGTTIPAQREYQICVERNDPILPAKWKEIEGGVTQLYVFIHIEYGDVFKERYEVGSLVTYDYRMRQFRVHENPGYNYNRKKNK